MSDPAANCKFAAGSVVPFIDPRRCEGKGPCVPSCPYSVLAIRIVPREQRAALPLTGRFKLFVHGGKQAFLPQEDACHGCGLCVQVCPERAITLRKRGEPAGN